MPDLRGAVVGGQGPAAEYGSRTCRRRVRPWSCGGANAACVCGEGLCPRRSFTQTADAVRPRGRVTERLRDKVASAIATSNRSVADVAGEYGVSWPTAHRALVVAAARWLPEPEPTAVLGIDETRFRSVRWILDGITWRRSDPWLTSFVDCTPGRPGATARARAGPHRRLCQGLAR